MRKGTNTDDGATFFLSVLPIGRPRWRRLENEQFNVLFNGIQAWFPFVIFNRFESWFIFCFVALKVDEIIKYIKYRRRFEERNTDDGATFFLSVLPIDQPRWRPIQWRLHPPRYTSRSRPVSGSRSRSIPPSPPPICRSTDSRSRKRCIQPLARPGHLPGSNLYEYTSVDPPFVPCRNWDTSPTRRPVKIIL